MTIVCRRRISCGVREVMMRVRVRLYARLARLPADAKYAVSLEVELAKGAAVEVCSYSCSCLLKW